MDRLRCSIWSVILETSAEYLGHDRSKNCIQPFSLVSRPRSRNGSLNSTKVVTWATERRQCYEIDVENIFEEEQQDLSTVSRVIEKYP